VISSKTRCSAAIFSLYLPLQCGFIVDVVSFEVCGEGQPGSVAVYIAVQNEG
jgi:hypothetical protein